MPGIPVMPLALSLSGCTLLGVGPSAGAAVGGCALLDDNEDDRVTAAEVSEALFDDWDADENGVLSEKAFDVGAQNTGAFTDNDGGFDAWDTDNDDELTRDEFDTGISEIDAERWADATCDDLGL